MIRCQDFRISGIACTDMGYRRAEEILPAGIIKEIQKYADGVNIYIPRKEENRREWGEKTSYRYDADPFVCGKGKDNLLANGEKS